MRAGAALETEELVFEGAHALRVLLPLIKYDQATLKERLHGFDACKLVTFYPFVAYYRNMPPQGISNFAELIQHQVLHEVGLHEVHHRHAPGHPFHNIIMPSDHGADAALVGIYL